MRPRERYAWGLLLTRRDILLRVSGPSGVLPLIHVLMGGQRCGCPTPSLSIPVDGGLQATQQGVTDDYSYHHNENAGYSIQGRDLPSVSASSRKSAGTLRGSGIGVYIIERA